MARKSRSSHPPIVEEAVDPDAPGDTVLDPFSGTGTTGEAAVGLGRNYIGVEIDARWEPVARARIERAATGGSGRTKP